ncbi:hypothetical protein BGZ75_004077 [Mortierella antarctica]|nr:hypothetical protein BGZ75_004077 [Mortierella antarctica]
MDTLLLQPATDTPGDTSRATVFDIPLLLDLIVQHLTTHDIYRCTLVSHHFHNVFQHCLYSTISIQQEEALNKFTCKEAMNAFSSYISCVRELSTASGECIMHLIDTASLQCTLPQALRSTSVPFKNLAVLRYIPETFHPYRSAKFMNSELYSSSTLSLLEASPTLQVVQLSGFPCQSDALILRLAKIIREKGRRLKEFRIDSHGFRPNDGVFYTLLWSCAAVEALIMLWGPASRGPTGYSSEMLPDLKALAREALSSKGLGSHRTHPDATAAVVESSQDTGRIEFAWKDLGPGDWLVNPAVEMIRELLQMCPFLEHLAFPELIEQDVITHLAPILTRSMPQLHHLNLYYIHQQPLGTCRVVQSCKDLISLYMDRMHFDPCRLVDAVVSGHGHSLQSLHIERSVHLSSQQLNLILSNCPRLISLYALLLENHHEANSFDQPPTLNTSDMALVPEKPGWGCKDLETLQLRYSSVDPSIGMPEVLWRQIGQLSKLKELKLERHGCYQAPLLCETESVIQAVSSWMALLNLRRLELRQLDAFVDEALVKQVRKKWPQLKWMPYTDA